MTSIDQNYSAQISIEPISTFLKENIEVVKYFELVLSVSVELSSQNAIVFGVQNNVEKAVRAISQVVQVVSNYEELDIFTVKYLIDLAISGDLYDASELLNQAIYHTPKGRAIRTKTLGQSIYVRAILRKDLVFCIGPAGSGKTFLAVAMAVRALREKEVSRIILTRPAVEAGEQLGFLPGDIQEKVDPYMRPIFDALRTLLGDDGFQKYYDKGIIEVSPLAFMRGRTLDDAFILLDEAQNTTIEQMKMFLTRIGLNSKTCVCGDVTQIDLPRGSKSGLSDAVDLLYDIDNIETVRLHQTDIVRNPLVSRIVSAYEHRVRKEDV